MQSLKRVCVIVVVVFVCWCLVVECANKPNKQKKQKKPTSEADEIALDKKRAANYNRILNLSRKRGPVVSLSPDEFNSYIRTSPRNYSVMIMFATRQPCPGCEYFDLLFKQTANEYNQQIKQLRETYNDLKQQRLTAIDTYNQQQQQQQTKEQQQTQQQQHHHYHNNGENSHRRN